MSDIKLIAFDLDGTLTQHKEPLLPEHRQVLDALGEKYRLVMVGAGQVGRIFRQMGQYPIDIIGNYGMQLGCYREGTGELEIVRDAVVSCDRDAIEGQVTALREKYGYTAFAGNNVEYHPSGCLTFPILGTKAAQADKLVFDPDRRKRRVMYEDVVASFPEYHVFIGGSSSFDMAPKPYNKYYALDLYARELGLSHDQVVFVGDDYQPGGNDASVFESDFGFLTVDDYRTFPQRVAHLL